MTVVAGDPSAEEYLNRGRYPSYSQGQAYFLYACDKKIVSGEEWRLAQEEMLCYLALIIGY